jgi:hypothetical protein
MIQIILLLLILLLPVTTEAAYKIHLQDGSVISGVGFYEKKGSDVALYFKDGSMWVPEKDIIKIEETESGELYVSPEQEQATQEIVTIVPSEEPASEEISRMETLRADVEALNKEIQEANLEESRLVLLINEKLSNKTVWNQYQVRQMENELKPYQEELRAVQQKKIELIERKGSLESEISQLTQR